MSPNTVLYITQQDNGEGELSITLTNIALWSITFLNVYFSHHQGFYQIQQFITSTSGQKMLTEGIHCEPVLHYKVHYHNKNGTQLLGYL